MTTIADRLAEALDHFWNAALGVAHQSGDATVNAVIGSMAQGFAAVAAKLREPDETLAAQDAHEAQKSAPGAVDVRQRANKILANAVDEHTKTDVLSMKRFDDGYVDLAIARAAIESALSAAPQAVDGFVLVPRLMTADMINAWSNGRTVTSDEVAFRTPFQDGWKRVLSAAPAPQSALSKHTTEDDYRHFLAYSGLDHSEILRYAYYHGADVGLDKPGGPSGDGGQEVHGPPVPEIFPGTLMAVERLTISGDDRQFCNTHGMSHSVEMRDADCQFESDEQPPALAPVQVDECGNDRLGAEFKAHDAQPPAPGEAELPDAGSCWWHKNGNFYTVLTISNTDSTRPEYPLTVVYRGDNGKVWSRLASDWNRSMTLITAAADGAGELPPLPESVGVLGVEDDYYTAGCMRDYARAAIAALRKPVPDAVNEEELVQRMTAAMREADDIFQGVGGSTRHHIRDCLLPILAKHGLALNAQPVDDSVSRVLTCILRGINDVRISQIARDCAPDWLMGWAKILLDAGFRPTNPDARDVANALALIDSQQESRND